MHVSSEVKADLTRRLKRLEGQVRGVQRMLEEDRDCREIIQQLAAIRSATHQASLVVVREHAAACLFKSGEQASPQDVLDSLIDVLQKA